MPEFYQMKFKLTSGYKAVENIRGGRPHNGIDLAMPEGTPLRAVMNGTVKSIVDYGDANAGKTILVELENGETVVYGHLSDFAVKEGDPVKFGDLIGYSGNTGHSTGPHLHFAVKDENGAFTDPSEFEPVLQEVTGSTGNFITQKTSEWGNNAAQKIDQYLSSKLEDLGEGIFAPIVEAVSNGLSHTIGVLNANSPEIITLALIICGAGMMIQPMVSNNTPWGGRTVLVLFLGIVWRMII